MTSEASALGDLLRTAREAVGWGLPRMAKETGYSVPYLSKLETGGKPVRPWHIELYDKAFGGDTVRRRALLLMGAGMVTSAMWAELELLASSPNKVDPADVAALEETALYLTGLGLRYGGQSAIALAKGQLRYSLGLLDLSMTDHVQDRILGVTSRIADRTAWSMSDAGQEFAATKIFDLAISIAPDEAHHCLSTVNLANLRLSMDDPRASLRLLEPIETRVPVLSFLAHSARANAHAMLGDVSGCVRHVGLADDSHALVDLENLPEPIRPYASGHEGHAHSAAGKALTVLAQRGSKKAVSLAVQRLEAAIEAFGPERAHAVASCTSRLTTLVG